MSKHILDRLLIRETYDQIKPWVLRHKLISLIGGILLIGALVLIVGLAVKGQADTSYVLARVEKGTVMSTISGSGQVSSSHQIDLMPKASGDVVAVNVKTGQRVKEGALLVRLDGSDAQKTVRDAQLSLQNAEISLQKTQNSLGKSSALQAKDALTQAEQKQERAQEDLERTYTSAVATIDGAYVTMTDTFQLLEDALYYQDYGGGSRYDSAIDDMEDAKEEYEEWCGDYRTLSYSNESEVEDFLSDTSEVVQPILEAVRTTNSYLAFLDNLGEARENLAATTAALTKLNSTISQIASSQSDIRSANDAVLNAETAIELKQEAVKQTQDNDDELELLSAQIAVTQRRNALNDALEKLADYSVRAPFDGTIAQVNVQAKDTVSSGTAVATIITEQSLLEISLNEVDVVNAAVGDKATITFDAIEDLSISGQVASVDYIGAVEQGVVNYIVTISFDTQDERIRPGMSASAVIITEMKQDVLMLSSGAIKSQGNSRYVEKINSNSISKESSTLEVSAKEVETERQVIEVGISDDTNTEIVNGLEEGDLVVVRTVTSLTSTKSASSSSSSAGILGGMGGSTRPMGGDMMSGPPR
jgi:HlyD family secretion protein